MGGVQPAIGMYLVPKYGHCSNVSDDLERIASSDLHLLFVVGTRGRRAVADFCLVPRKSYSFDICRNVKPRC